MIISIRSGEWSQWAGNRDEEYFARLLNGLGWRIAVRNQDFKRLNIMENEESSDSLSVDSIATFFDPVKQRFEAVFIEAKRRTDKPSQDDVVKWIEKCRRAQSFIEASDDIQGILCTGIKNQESIHCSKSILFIDCDQWPDIRKDRLTEILPIEKRTSRFPRRIQIIDKTRALWMQHTLDVLGLLRSPLNHSVESYKVYYWKKGFHENVSFDHLVSELLLFEIKYENEDKRDLVLISYEDISTEVAIYYAGHLADLLDGGAHAYNRLILFTYCELDIIAIESTANIFKDSFKGLADNLHIDIRVRTLPTGLNR